MNPTVHISHTMRMDAAHLLAGQWYGTWRCTRCTRHYVRHNNGEIWTDERLKGPCVAGEIINPHVIDHVEEPNRFPSLEGADLG